MSPIDRLLIAAERFLVSKTAENWIWIFAGIALLCFLGWATQAVFVAMRMLAQQVGM